MINSKRNLWKDIGRLGKISNKDEGIKMTNENGIWSAIRLLTIRFYGDNGVECKNIHFKIEGYSGFYFIHFAINLDKSKVSEHYLHSRNRGVIKNVQWFDVIGDKEVIRYNESGNLKWYVLDEVLLINIEK